MGSSASDTLQCLFLGTGTSTGLPLAPCLTLTQPYPDEFVRHLPLPVPNPNPPPGHYNPKGEWPSNIPCACCRGAVCSDVPEGWKNRRGNTSVVVRKKRDGEWRNVVVDVGKTFREQSMRFFPRWGVNRIDAVILTHGHADAYYGLDDLREWCYRQRSVIPVYLNKETYETVAMSFPYLVDKTKASGGGDVPALRFHIIEDDADFEVEGIQVRALPVEHGIYFRDDKREPLICLGFMFDFSIIYMSDVSEVPETTWARMLDRTPTKRGDNQEDGAIPSHSGSNGFLAKPVSAIPDRIKGNVVIPPTPQGSRGTSRSQSPIPSLNNLTLSSVSSSADLQNGTSTPVSPPPLPILIIDALWPIVRHSSHINFTTAVMTAIRLNPSITYLVDMVHPVSHYMWEELGKSIRDEHGKRADRRMDDDVVNLGREEREHPDAEQSAELVERYWEDKGTKRVAAKMKNWGGRVEPGWDGLVVEIGTGSGYEGGWREVKEKGGSVGGFHI